MKRKLGFSLVELSIVLVILGLLVGGVLAGKSLIRAAELRTVTTEYNRHYTGVQSFRDRYFALPGDMTNATAFWGIAGGTGNDGTCRSTYYTGITTCNGNGDGTLANSTGSYESYRFWQHLANAGLIEGSYSGGGAGLYVGGTDVPISKHSAGAIWVTNYTACPITGNTARFDGNCGNTMFTAIRDTVTPGWYGGLDPSEAWNIDTKSDDGMPGTGRIVAPWSGSYSASGVKCTLAANSAEMTAAYNISVPDKACLLWARFQK